MAVRKGLQLWLDATEEKTISKFGVDVVTWTSKDTERAKPIVLTCEYTETKFGVQVPSFHPPDDFSPASIEFDFNKTLYFGTPLTEIRTVISVHKYKNTVKTTYTTGYEYTKWIAVCIYIY